MDPFHSRILNKSIDDLITLDVRRHVHLSQIPLILKFYTKDLALIESPYQGPSHRLLLSSSRIQQLYTPCCNIQSVATT